jgi:hypothetical protein
MIFFLGFSNMKYLSVLILLGALTGCQTETTESGSSSGSTILGLGSPAKIAAVPSN